MIRSRRQALQMFALGTVGMLPAISACSRWVRPTPSREFLEAVRTGNLESVRQLLAARPQLLRAVDEQGRSAFALARLAGQDPVAELLVGRGYIPDAHEAALAADWERFAELLEADPSLVDADHPIGGSTMYAAAAGGAGSEIWRIYAATGDPNAMPRGARGASPLQAALRYRDLAVAEMTAATLLSNASDPDPQSSIEDPPLHVAAGRGSSELVEMLIRHGADVNRTDREGRLARQVAREAGHAEVAAMLDAHATIPRNHSTSRTAYDATGGVYDPPDISAIPLPERRRFVGQSHGNLDYVRDALAGDPRLAHSVATTSEICVEACAHTGRTNIVEFLLEHGAPYSLPTAVMRGDLPRVNQLLDEDPLRIHERGAHDFALLWYPVIGRTGLEMMELLLTRGAEVERQHFLGTTALHWAAMRGRIEMVELLIDHGADVDRTGRKFGAEPESPLQAALKSDQPGIAELLIARGARR